MEDLISQVSLTFGVDKGLPSKYSCELSGYISLVGAMRGRQRVCSGVRESMNLLRCKMKKAIRVFVLLAGIIAGTIAGSTSPESVSAQQCSQENQDACKRPGLDFRQPSRGGGPYDYCKSVWYEFDWGWAHFYVCSLDGIDYWE